jgi:hypothetical protein
MRISKNIGILIIVTMHTRKNGSLRCLYLTGVHTCLKERYVLEAQQTGLGLYQLRHGRISSI